MPDIVLEGLTRRFGAVAAVDDVSARFAEGRVTCLLGPSGCGKTTLMRVIAGLERPTAGRIRFGDRDVTGLAAAKRNVAMVFQYPVMYRTLTVEENIGLAMRNDRTLGAAERRERLEEVLAVLGLEAQRRAGIDRLDSGTRQRVAVGRAIARSCDVILFDEPTTNVEVHAKLELIRAFNLFRARMRQTIVYVTHDQTEAMTLADEIALMQDGRITQSAPPRTLYERPESEFGGWFLGAPGMNFVAPVGERDGGVRFAILPTALQTPEGGTETLRIGIRPEHARIAPPGAPGVSARVLRRSITVGGRILLLLEVGADRLRVRADPAVAVEPGDTVTLQCPLEHMTFFRAGRRLPDRPRTMEYQHAGDQQGADARRERDRTVHP